MNTVEAPGIWFRTICKRNGLIPTDRQIQLLEQYAALLIEWNKKINLISRREEDRVWQNHILHSVSPLFKLKLVDRPRIMDLGCGGGLPGIPLKIFLPDSEFVLLDSTRKKIMTVQDIIMTLGIDGISAVWGRAEEVASQNNLVSHFDYIVARAVAPLNDLIKWSIPFLRRVNLDKIAQPAAPLRVVPPALIALKGGDLENELSKAKRAHAIRSVEVVNLVFPGSEEMSAPDKRVVIVGL
jgi:16S rRNA (guanine527-N7)-methyltransferase